MNHFALAVSLVLLRSRFVCSTIALSQEYNTGDGTGYGTEMFQS